MLPEPSRTEIDLLEHIKKTGNIPEHVAIIMDGNRRWAKERGKPFYSGHTSGAGVLREVCKKSPYRNRTDKTSAPAWGGTSS